MNALESDDRRIQELMEYRPKQDPTLYDETFASTDTEIRNRYRDVITPGALSFFSPMGTASLSPISPASGPPPLSTPANSAIAEMANREAIATYVLRLRLKAGLKNSMKLVPKSRPLERASQSLRSVQNTVEKIKRQSISIGPASDPITLHYGYDLITDVSSIWWQRGDFQVGLVKAGLLNTLHTNWAGFSNSRLQLTKSLGTGAPTAFLWVPLSGNAIDLGISHTLFSAARTQLSFAARPSVGGTPHYEMIQATVGLPF